MTKPCPYCGDAEFRVSASHIHGHRKLTCRGCLNSQHLPAGAARPQPAPPVDPSPPPASSADDDTSGGAADPDQVTTPLTFEDVGIPARWVSILRGAGIETVEQIQHATDKELIDINGIGEKTVALIRGLISARE